MRFVRVTIYFLTIILFFSGLLESIGIPLVLIKFLSEFCVVLGFVFLLLSRVRITVRPNLVILTSLYFGATMISVYTTHGSIIDGFKYLRYMVLIVLLLIQFNTLFRERIDIKIYMKFMYNIFIIQIVYAFLEIVFIGVEEEVVGTIFLNGGEYATILPLIILAFSAFYYMTEGGRRHLIIGLLSITIGFASAKRGILFFFPASVVALFLLDRFQRWGFYATLLPGLVVIGLVLPVIGILARYNSGIASSSDGAFSSFVAAANYSKEYSSGINYRGYTIGRSSTSMNVLLHSLVLNKNTFFGYGPDILLGNSGDFEPYKIDYGIVGWSKSILSIGWFGLVTEILLLREIFTTLKRMVFGQTATSKFRIFYWLILGQAFLIYFSYSVLLTASLYLVLPYFIIVAGIANFNYSKTHG